MENFPIGAVLLIVGLIVFWIIGKNTFISKENVAKATRDGLVARGATEIMTPEELSAYQLGLVNKIESSNTFLYGQINPHLVCPHCHNEGMVRSMRTTEVTKSRVNSIPAKVIGLGTNSSKDITQMRCDNCQTIWTV